MDLPPKIINELIQIQKNELNEYYVYSALAKRVENTRNSEILNKIAKEELAHAKFWRHYTGVVPKASRVAIAFYKVISSLLGLTFSLKLMEHAEEKAQNV
ncbi:MAG: rubrerythrin family protein, partial [Candidatus Kapaibacteriota bacterium]